MVLVPCPVVIVLLYRHHSSAFANVSGLHISCKAGAWAPLQRLRKPLWQKPSNLKCRGYPLHQMCLTRVVSGWVCWIQSTQFSCMRWLDFMHFCFRLPVRVVRKKKALSTVQAWIKKSARQWCSSTRKVEIDMTLRNWKEFHRWSDSWAQKRATGYCHCSHCHFAVEMLPCVVNTFSGEGRG